MEVQLDDSHISLKIDALPTREEDVAVVNVPDRSRCAKLPQFLHIFWVLALVAFGLTILVGYVEFRLGFPPPHYNPLGGSRYDDLLEYLPTFRLLHTGAFFHNPSTSPVAYPPFAAILFALTYHFSNPVAFYLTVAACALAVGFWGVYRGLIQHGMTRSVAALFPLTILVTSFPIVGLLQRGNIEMFLWIFAAAGTWAFLRGHDFVAAVLWALAASTKLYPAIFLILLIPRRSYRAFAVGVAGSLISSILSMWYIGPDIKTAWNGSVGNVFGYQTVRVSEWTLHELAANHSAFGLVKLGAIVLGTATQKLTIPYYLCGALVMAVTFFRRLDRMPVANQLLAVSAFMLMFPPISYFYTLVHLYAPFLVLVFLAIRSDQAGVRIPGLATTVFLILPLFTSFMLFTYPRVMLFGGLIQALLLTSLFISALSFPFAEPSRPTTPATP